MEKTEFWRSERFVDGGKEPEIKRTTDATENTDKWDKILEEMRELDSFQVQTEKQLQGKKEKYIFLCNEMEGAETKDRFLSLGGK